MMREDELRLTNEDPIENTPEWSTCLIGDCRVLEIFAVPIIGIICWISYGFNVSDICQFGFCVDGRILQERTYLTIVTILAEKTRVRARIDSARRTFREMKTMPDGREGRNGLILGDIVLVAINARCSAVGNDPKFANYRVCEEE